MLCEDVCSRLQVFAHVDMSRVLVSFIPSRNNLRHGLQARLTPLRFEGGELTALRGRHRYQMQRFITGSVECKYVLTFSLPRFLNQTFTEKLVTVFHELYHIDPEFKGELRGHAHTKCVHGGDQRKYDLEMLELCKKYLNLKPQPSLFDFLRLNATQLGRQFHRVVGIQIPTPKLIPILEKGNASKDRRS